MNQKREMLRHFLAALAYRTQKALRDAPEEYASFSATDGVRTPIQLVRHMTSVLGYARTYFIGGQYQPVPLPTLSEETKRFHEMLEDLAQHLKIGTPLLLEMTEERLLQGPFADAMTHAGQLAMLRRLSGSPIPPENFIVAEIDTDQLGIVQAKPKSPDEIWNEAPEGWIPPSKQSH
jgi:hypothetical protein